MTTGRRAVLVLSALTAAGACAGSSPRARPDDAAIDSGPGDATTPHDSGSSDGRTRSWADAASPGEREPVDALVRDAGFDDEAEAVLEPAPPCAAPEPEPALDVVGPVPLEVGTPPRALGRVLHAVVPDDAADAADLLYASLRGVEGPLEWRVMRMDSGGTLGRAVRVDDYPSDRDAFGGAARARDGGLLVAWRGGRVSSLLGTDAYTAWIARGGATPVAGPTMHRSAAADGVGDSTPLVLGEAELLVSTLDEGLVVSALGRPGRLVVRVDALPGSPNRVVVLDESRFGVAWSERLGTHGSRARLAVVDASGAAVTRSIYGLGDHTTRDVALAALHSELWVARFERIERDLDDSHVRISRLDADLRRVEPDRWLDGWGGAAPGNLELVVFEGRPWLVWVTTDARYGRLVVHASPVPSTACGRAAGAAAVVLPEGLLGPTDLVAVASRARLWVAVTTGGGSDPVLVYVLTPRE